MLYWICPECGGECSPAIRECPACAGTTEISPASASPVRRKAQVTEEVLALAQNLQPVGRAPSAASSGLSSHNGRSAPTATIELPAAPMDEEPVCAPAQEAIESLVRPLVESTILAPPPAKASPDPLAPEMLCDALALQAELVLDAMAQQNLSEEQAAISGIIASFQQRPTVGLLAAAGENIEAPAPLCVRWMPIPKPHIPPVPPKDPNHRELLSGLQTPPLAGPCVPGQLRSLTETRGSAGRTRKKAGLPAWTL